MVTAKDFHEQRTDASGPQHHRFSEMFRIWAVLKSTVGDFLEDNVSLHGASLAFFTIFALPPLLVLTVQMLGWFIDGSTIESQILLQIRRLGGPNSVEIFRTILQNAVKPSSSNFFALLVSTGVLLFSASNLFAQIQFTLNTVWGVKVNPKVTYKAMVMTRLWSFVLILAVGLVVVALLLIDLIIALLQNTLGAQLGILETLNFYQSISLVVSWFLQTAAVAAVFKILPDVKSQWRDIWVGAAVTSILLTLSKYVISWYLSAGELGTAYGAAGSFIIFLFWLYLNIQIFLLGAEFTESYAREFGCAIQPNKYAVWLREHHQEPPSEQAAEKTKATEG